jgi:gamma-glutamylcysteine synthetase
MTKTQLQQELLEKVKPGTKPSDIKKQSQKQVKKPVLSSPRSLSRSDEGYESDKSIPKAPPLSNSLQAQITSLKKQLQLYKDFREADLKVKEKLKQENQSLKKTMANLQKAKPTAEPQLEVKPSTFTCASCTRAFDIELIRLIKKSGKQICRNCTLLMLKRANQFHGQHIVLKIKKSLEKPQPTFTCQICQQSAQETPHQVHVSNFSEAGINPRQLTSVCSTCLAEKVVLANFYCPRTSEGRDTYNPHEPQFDCDCPNERSQT